MTGLLRLGDKAWGPRNQQSLSAWHSGGNRIWNILFVDLSVCLIWAGDYFRDLQSHPFDPFFS